MPRLRRCAIRSTTSMISTSPIFRKFGGAAALATDAQLAKFGGRVSDSGEGRWTIKAAIDEGVPVPVLTTALYERFSSRGEADYQDRLLSAMRFGFGGHLEKSGK